MAHKLREEIGADVHNLDRFFGVEETGRDKLPSRLCPSRALCPIELRPVRVCR